MIAKKNFVKISGFNQYLLKQKASLTDVAVNYNFRHLDPDEDGEALRRDHEGREDLQELDSERRTEYRFINRG